MFSRISSQRRESIAAAVKGQTAHSKTWEQGHGAEGFLPDYFTLALVPKSNPSNPGKRVRSQKRKFDASEPIRDQRKKRRVETPQAAHAIVVEDLLDVPRDIAGLEVYWKALLEYSVAQAEGRASHEFCDELAFKYGYKSGRTIRELPLRLRIRGTLMRKPGSGASKSVSGDRDILDFFEKKAKEWEYVFTYEAMAVALKSEFDVGSTKTVKAIMDHLEYRKKRRIIRPFLTPEHLEDRFNWSIEWKDFDFFDNDVVVVHIDEKCFYAFQESGKVCYCPPGVDPEPFYALSKTQIPWCMFLGAVAAPRWDKDFDGKIGLWHVGEEKVALRNSKFHDKGDVYWVNVNMDGDLFVNMVRTYLIPAIIQKCSWAKKIIVQLDSAGGHRVNSTVVELNNVGSTCNPPIEFRTQPCRSPDTNVLDLGTWKSMQSRVVEVKYNRFVEESINQRIINAVNDMWSRYPSDKLADIFMTLKAVLYEIEAANGGNSFKQPRKLKNKDD